MSSTDPLIPISVAASMAKRQRASLTKAAMRGSLGAVQMDNGRWYTSAEALGAYIARTQGRIRRRDGSYPGCSRRPRPVNLSHLRSLQGGR